jgi:hypothetical protein
MKKIILLILISVLFKSCSSDDSLPNDQFVPNAFSINGLDYSTPNGYMIQSTDGVNYGKFAIYLLNGGIINNEWNGESCDYTSSLTQGVVLNITSPSTTNLSSGIYYYQLNSIEPSLNETIISTDIVVTNNCIVSSNSIAEEQILNGSVNIVFSNSTYTIDYFFTTTSFGSISGNYSGSLQLVTDLSD